MDYLPRKQSEFVQWSRNFTARVEAAPGSFGLDAAQAAAHRALHDAFIAAYEVAVDPGTRTRTAVSQKNAARTALIEHTRMLVKIVQAAPATTNAMRSLLRITVADAEPTPVPAPSAAPELAITSVTGRRAALRLIDPNAGARWGKPEGVFGAMIYGCVSEDEPPEALDRWTLLTAATRMHIELEFPTSIPAGAKVWLTACWINTTAKPGPHAPIVCTRFTENVARAA
jgi:hypothetical protein